MPWGEALRLTECLMSLPDSMVAAAAAGWQYSVTRGELVAMDHFDAYARATFKRPKPYPRPWDPAPKRMGNASLTIEQLRVILDHHRALPMTSDGGGSHR